MFCLYFSVSTCSENRTGFGIRSSKHSSTSHCLSSKADVGLRGPKGLGASLKNTKLRAELNISLEWRRKSQHISGDFSLAFWDLFRQFSRNIYAEMLSDYNVSTPPHWGPDPLTMWLPPSQGPCKWGPWSSSFIYFIVSLPLSVWSGADQTSLILSLLICKMESE